jgi:uncharacterized membrane protein YidH (DUF202 family)
LGPGISAVLPAPGFVAGLTKTTERGRRIVKPATVIGVILIIVGIVGFALGGFSFTHEKKDVDAGPIQIGHTQTKTVPIPPALSVIALIGGIGLVAVGMRSK